MTERLCKMSAKGNDKRKQTNEIKQDNQRDKTRCTQQKELWNRSRASSSLSSPSSRPYYEVGDEKFYLKSMSHHTTEDLHPCPKGPRHRRAECTIFFISPIDERRYEGIKKSNFKISLLSCPLGTQAPKRLPASNKSSSPARIPSGPLIHSRVRQRKSVCALAISM